MDHSAEWRKVVEQLFWLLIPYCKEITPFRLTRC
jgi:hypothetical protein